MPDDLIKARIVFDATALDKAMKCPSVGGADGGFAEAISKTAMNQDSPVWGDILAGLGGLVLVMRAVFDVVKAGFGKLVEASPHLQATLGLMARVLKITLRPIGDTVSMLLRPFIISWMRIVLPIYKRWREWFGGEAFQKFKLELGEGFAQVKEGIFELDWEKVKEGLDNIWDAFSGMWSSFYGDVLGPEFDKLGEWWDRLQEKLGTEGFWSTMFEALRIGFLHVLSWFAEKMGVIGEGEEFESFKDALSRVFSFAWDYFKETVTGTPWEKVFDFAEVLYDIWLKFTEKLEEFKWAGPLGVFAAAALVAWEGVVEPMVEALVNALEEKLPGLGTLLSFLGGGDDDEGGFLSSLLEGVGELWESLKGGFASLWETITTLDAWIEFWDAVTGGFTSLWETISDTATVSFTAVETALGKTDVALQNSQDETDSLITKLNDIPRHITTVHTIKTVHVSGD